MNRTCTALLAFLMAIAPVAAQEGNADFGFAKDGIIAEINSGNSDGEVISPPPETMFSDIAVEGMSLPLFTKPLSDIQAAFGGEIQTWDSYGYVHHWLCYVDAGQRTWYLTDGGDTPESAIVGWFVSEPSNPALDGQYGCSVQPLAMPVQGGDFPTIGATAADLAAHFGAPLASGADSADYFSQHAMDEGYDLVRMAYYRLTEGIVTSVSFSQWDSR
jgi:hypothetical protein